MSVARELNTSARFLSADNKVLPGVRRVVLLATPAAGAQWSVPVPGGVMWRVLAGRATLTTDATVANRFPCYTVTVNGTEVYRSGVNFPPVASGTYQITYTRFTGAQSAQAASAPQMIPVDFDWTPNGAVIASVTPGMDAADTYTAVSLWVEELYTTDNQLSGLAELDWEAFYAAEQATEQAAVTATTPGG